MLMGRLQHGAASLLAGLHLIAKRNRFFCFDQINMAIYSISDIRNSWGATWADASDMEVLLAYSKAIGQEPSEVAIGLGTRLENISTAPFTSQRTAVINGDGFSLDAFANYAAGKVIYAAPYVLTLMLPVLLYLIFRRFRSNRTVFSTKRKDETDYAGKADSAVYQKVADELEAGSQDRPLWLKVFADCDGDHNRAKAAYVRERVRALKQAP